MKKQLEKLRRRNLNGEKEEKIQGALARISERTSVLK